MSRASVDHAPLERSRLPVEKCCTDINPGDLRYRAPEPQN